MKRNLVTSTAAALAASLTLAACGGDEPENRAGAEAGNAANAQRAEIALPPSIEKSRIYRCRDNSVVYVDFLDNDTAALRTEQTGLPTTLATDSGEPPYRAEGYSVSANAEQATIAVPGRAAQPCRARS